MKPLWPSAIAITHHSAAGSAAAGRPVSHSADPFFCYRWVQMLKLLRQQAKRSELSQSEIARQIGVSRYAISHFIAGRSSLSLKRADRLAKILGLKLMKVSRRIPPLHAGAISSMT